MKAEKIVATTRKVTILNTRVLFSIVCACLCQGLASSINYKQSPQRLIKEVK